MIIPVNDPMFAPATDAEFRARMIKYISDNFNDVLGKDARLLDQPNGLDLVQDKVNTMLAARGIKTMRARKAA